MWIVQEWLVYILKLCLVLRYAQLIDLYGMLGLHLKYRSLDT